MNVFCCCFSWSDFWALLTALATIVLAYIAWKQIGDLKKTAKADFLHKLKEGFFTKEARDIVILLELDALLFESELKHKDFAVFKVNVPAKLKEYLKDSIDFDRQYYTTQEMDDFILGHLEDAGLLLKNKTIDIKDADQQFQYYTQLIFENKEIQKYIQWARKDDNDIYSNLQYIFNELNKYEQKINAN
jgi:hypothetical protein